MGEKGRAGRAGECRDACLFREQELGDSVRYLQHRINQLGVRVALGVEATLERVLAEKADVVVVATGSAPYKPELPGLEQDNVLTVWEALMGKASGAAGRNHRR